jgi:hypothetical protein
MRVGYRFLFVVVSTVTVLIALRLIHAVPDRRLWIGPSVFRWVMHSAQAAAVVFSSLTFQYLDAAEFLGLR